MRDPPHTQLHVQPHGHTQDGVIQFAKPCLTRKTIVAVRGYVSTWARGSLIVKCPDRAIQYPALHPRNRAEPQDPTGHHIPGDPPINLFVHHLQDIFSPYSLETAIVLLALNRPCRPSPSICPENIRQSPGASSQEHHLASTTTK